MLRLLVRSIPRFSLLTILAAGLLLVSVAGWVKIQIDLRDEEAALFRDLAKAGVSVSFRRQGDDRNNVEGEMTGPEMAFARLWRSVFRRVESIDLDPDCPRPLLERAAALPYVEDVSCEPMIGSGAGRLKPLAHRAGLDLPNLESPVVPTELEPLPQGEPIDDAEANRVWAGVIDAANVEAPSSPQQGIAYYAGGPFGSSLCAHDGDRMLLIYDAGTVVLCSRDEFASFVDGPDGIVQAARSRSRDFSERFFDLGVELSRPWRQFNTEVARAGVSAFPSLPGVRKLPGDCKVARTTDVGYRVDFPPRTIDHAPAPSVDVVRVSAIFRSDLDWEPEAYDIVVERTTTGAAKTGLTTSVETATFGYRAHLRRERGRVVVDSFIEDPIVLSASHLPMLTATRRAFVAHVDLSPDLDLSQATPETLGAKLLPERSASRLLLFWPWATLTVSLCLFADAWRRRSASTASDRRLDAAGFRCRLRPDWTTRSLSSPP